MVCNDKTIAILLATYNGEKYIVDLLESLLAQDDRDFRCFVHDDGSIDETVEILRKYESEYTDFLTVIDGTPTGSPKGNFMFLLKEIVSEYYMFCDQDDVWHDNKVSISRKFLEKILSGYPNKPYCVFSDLRVTDSELKVKSDSFYRLLDRDPRNTDYIQLLKKNIFVGCTMMFNKSLRDETIKLKNINNIPMHDFWIGIVASLKGRVCFINKPLIEYRQHDANNMGASQSIKTVSDKVRNISYIYRMKKNKIIEQHKIAAELMHLFDKDDKYYSFFKQLAEISDKSKIERLKFYKESGLLSDGNILLNILSI